MDNEAHRGVGSVPQGMAVPEEWPVQGCGPHNEVSASEKAGPMSRGGTEPASYRGLPGEGQALRGRAAEGGGLYGMSYR